jgi:hypothetical protein
VKLDQDDIEAIARRVAELVRPDPERPARYLTVGQLAEQFGVSTEWVYEHKAELGAIRLGDGPKARLRFDREHVTEIIGARRYASVRRRSGGRDTRSAPGRVLPGA